MTVAHDHGYCCLQTKAVPGAVFEGASDGAVACNNVTTEPVRLHNACITACNFKDAGPISANQKLRYR